MTSFRRKPPFGQKSSVTIVNGAGESSKESLIINRDDFWAGTSKCEPHWRNSSIPPAHLHHPQTARPRRGGAAG